MDSRIEQLEQALSDLREEIALEMFDTPSDGFQQSWIARIDALLSPPSALAGALAACNKAIGLAGEIDALLSRPEQAEHPDDCGNCFEGKSDFRHVCKVCGGTGKAQPEHAEQSELWAVHAQGPDDLYAAFSREDAEQHAAALNALPMPEGISVSAVVIPSPWSAVEHWKYLAEQEQSGWISVEDRLPEPNKKVLAHSKRCPHFFARRKNRTRDPWEFLDGDTCHEKITHWQPLPALPQAALPTTN